jgi:hypothetical protein
MWISAMLMATRLPDSPACGLAQRLWRISGIGELTDIDRAMLISRHLFFWDDYLTARLWENLALVTGS